MDFEIIREADGVCVLYVNGERYMSGTWEQCDDAKRQLYDEAEAAWEYHTYTTNI